MHLPDIGIDETPKLHTGYDKKRSFDMAKRDE